MEQIELGEIIIEVVLKDIKNIHLAVHPPEGRVRIAAPEHMSLDTIRVFALTKLSWIKKQQQKFQNQEREAPREFLNRESHYFLGRRYLLKVVEKNTAYSVALKHNTIELSIRAETSIQKKKDLLNEWYRKQLKEIAAPLIVKWEKRMDVKVNELGIKKMKTKWGTCKREANRIWLNLDLAKKPITCIEYIVVHEMTHLLERNHNDRFIAYLNEYMPGWKGVRDELNQLPLVNVQWES